MVTTLKLSSHNVVQREKLENSFECTFEVSFSSKTCLVSLSFVASHFCLCSSVKAATLEKFENGMNFFWHSRLMSGWSKTFVLCKKKRRNCCKSWTNWQREILGLDVPFLDEKIIAKYLRILPSHLKVTARTQCLKITQNVAFDFFNFGTSTQFYPIQIDLSGTTFWPQVSVFQKLAKIDPSGTTFWPQVSVLKTRQNWPFLAFLINFCPLKM